MVDQRWVQKYIETRITQIETQITRIQVRITQILRRVYGFYQIDVDCTNMDVILPSIQVAICVLYAKSV